MAINRNTPLDLQETGLSAPEKSPLELGALETQAINDLAALGVIAKDGNSVNRDALKKLSKEQVEKLQASLNAAGFNTGDVDGIAGKNTLNGIRQAIAKGNVVTLLQKDELSRAEIKTVQQSLNRLGHDTGRVDGIRGPDTEKGIAGFLNKGNATTAPIVTITQPEIIAKVDPNLETVLGAYEHDEAAIKTLQTELADKGYYKGKIDGDFGPASQRGFIKYLEEHPEIHEKIGPNLTLEAEIYAAKHGVSDALRTSLNLRDLNDLMDVDAQTRYEAYKQHFESEGKPVELARGIKVAHELTGVPMENLFAVMRHESINFGDYKAVQPGRKGYSSANGMENNYGQFTNGTKGHMDDRYGDLARNELGREGIRYDAGKDWRDDPLVAPYMVAKYLKESGSVTDLTKQYPAHVLPALKGLSDNTVVANKYPNEARSNTHIFYENGRALTASEARKAIVDTLKDDLKAEKEVVFEGRLKALKDELIERHDNSTTPYQYDGINSRDPVIKDTPNLKDVFTQSAMLKPLEETFSKSPLGVSFRQASLGVSIGMDQEKPAVDRTLMAQNNNRLFDPSLSA